MSSRQKVNILLVDDQPAKLLSLETILAELEENTLRAESAEEALKFLLTHEIAVVLVDVCMPRVDGFELAELIRDHPRFQRTAIIFISAVHLTDADCLRGYSVGAVDYIPVPIIPEVLRAKVAVFAELYRKSNELERVNAELKQRVEELDQSNERLRFADRMATIGTLAAGLGHDMGNLLLPVRMRLDTIEACAGLPAPVKEDVGAIRKAAEYLQRLATSLGLLAMDADSEQPSEWGTDVAGWWKETEGMLRTGVSRTIQLRAEIEPALPPIGLGKAALTQIVFNLIQNASDALAGREDGRVTLNATTSEQPGKVLLRVTDNGPGMSDTVKHRCLEPFFTTKTRGLSTGMGLALVGSLVRRAKGTLRIETEQGKGTTFHLELPCAAAAEAERREPAKRHVAEVTLRDPRLRAHVSSVLEAMDYEIRQGSLGEARLWVTEASSHIEFDQACQFAAGQPARRAVVFGATLDYQDPDRRVLCLETSIKPSALRKRIQEVLSSH
ncbi:MAG: hybrid sensor histidine kinase/response regulator [Planctomycetes bacterium]|nr:hybrid sensor histidine kinase/response regulator [Planctomycetota bacterium]